MNYFVLFSVVIIVVSLVILISPLNNHASVMPIQEGFATRKQQRNVAPIAPVSAGQTNLSGTAGMADGSSDHKHLLDNLLKKQERLAEAFENRAANASKVSATTTKKKGIASTGANYDGDGDALSCSTCKYNVNKTTKCVLPGCYSADDGNLPFPDGDYNFAEGCFYYNPDPSNPGKILPGMEGREPGYYCPPITKGMSYDAGGGSGDPCYTKPNIIPDTTKPNSPGYILDYSKYVNINEAGKMCSNERAKSKQNFAPDDVEDNPMNPRTHQHQHQHSGNINVYHHRVSSQSTGTKKHMQNKQNMHNRQDMQKQQNNKQQNQSNTYQEPVGGATALGYL